MWEYKIKPSFIRYGMNKDWVKCTEEQKEKLIKMRPKHYEFREIKPPAPTPSMIDDKELIMPVEAKTKGKKSKK